MRLLTIRRAEELAVKGRSTVVIRVKERSVERGLRDIDAVLVIGSNIKISSSLPPVLSMHGIPLAIMAKDNISILFNPIITRYNNYRRLQYQIDKTKALDIALQYIKAKIKGIQNILKYHRKTIPETRPPPRPAEDPVEYEQEIRLWESTNSHTLWSQLVEIIKPRILESLVKEYGFNGRKPRHPDPFNKTLSVMYAVLYSLATKALIAAGLDPTYGFLHRTRYSTPLTFDYTEMFKPIAIQATIYLINHGEIPEIGEDGDLTRESVNKAIKCIYDYLVLKHKDTKKTAYQQIYLKAFCLAKYLEGRCKREWLTVTWDRRQYRI